MLPTSLEQAHADERPGRTCPLAYRYAPEALARHPDFHADTLYVVGGLYGNPHALETLLELVRSERGATALVFNGDFNWFDIDAPGFRAINEAVLAHRAIRGNVETELTAESDAAGCGCAYPEYVGDAEVEHSNAIMGRLRQTAAALPHLREAFAKLPMHLVAQVGESRVAIVHGDAHSLSGWDYSERVLATTDGMACLTRDCEAAQADVIASTHTCLPVAAGVSTSRGTAALFNNGAAGMPNFRGTRFGVVTRISIHPAAASLYGLRVGSIYADALAVHYDHARWGATFRANWPERSAGHDSYFRRITEGPDYDFAAAMRGSELLEGQVDAG